MGKTPQNIPPKLEISYYHPLRMWLLGATRGIQGLAMMDI